MSVWLCVPSARAPHETTFPKWIDQGYKVAVFRDIGAPLIPEASFVIVDKYPGYAVASNRLIQEVFARDPECDWVVGGGDDVEPDRTQTGPEIGRECSDWRADTFGVMQATGDRWGEEDPWAKIQYPNAPAYVDRICGSPWLGREFCRRVNQGRGPFWPQYYHMFVDEELQNVAQRLGVLWQRRDLTHKHNHWARQDTKESRTYMGPLPPEHLKEALSKAHWDEAKALFERRKAVGFPGSEPIA